MTVLSHEKGVGLHFVCSFLHLSRGPCAVIGNDFKRDPTAALFAKRVNTLRKSQDDRIRQAVFSLLHSPPSTYGIEQPGKWPTGGRFCERRGIRCQMKKLKGDVAENRVGDQ